jgi:hypothetical protein
MEDEPKYSGISTPPRPIGKFPSVTDAARALGLSRTQVKRLLDPKPRNDSRYGNERRIYNERDGW